MKKSLFILICSIFLTGCTTQTEDMPTTSPSPIVEIASPSPTPSPLVISTPIVSPKASPKAPSTSSSSLINAQAEVSCILSSPDFEPTTDQPRLSAIYRKYGVTLMQVSEFGLKIHQNRSGTEANAVKAKMSAICPWVPKP